MQKTALKILKSGDNVFLTGSAGTGKTHILNEFVLYLKSRKILPTIVAPTGIAASHLNGQTIHSYFSLGIRDEIDDAFISHLLEKKYLQTRFKKLKILIIDEISMVSPNIFSCIDKILQAFKHNYEPFGGIQVVLSGDFFQLPPISRNNDGKRFAWQSPSWKELDLQTCYLQKKFRQDDNELIFVLDEIRSGQVSQKSYDILNSRLQKDLDIDFTPTKLYTHNMDVDRINNDELRNINEEENVFKYESEGSKTNIEKLFKSALVKEELILKKDAVVMFIKNNPEKYYINGTTGVVIGFSKDEFKLPIVKLSSGYVIKVEYEDWMIENDKGKVQAKISQIPLKLAWAITIHKSQGMTLDAAQMDLSKTFEVGQGYVALSRIKNIAGLKLMGFNDNALRVDALILSIDPRIKQASKKASDKIESYDDKFLSVMHLSYIKRLGGSTDAKEIEREKVALACEPKVEEKVPNYIKTKNLVFEAKTIEQLAKNAGFSASTIMNHLTLIKKDEPAFDISKYMPKLSTLNLVNEAILQINETKNEEDFSETGTIKLKAIFTKLDEKISYDDIKMALI